MVADNTMFIPQGYGCYLQLRGFSTEPAHSAICEDLGWKKTVNTEPLGCCLNSFTAYFSIKSKSFPNDSFVLKAET